MEMPVKVISVLEILLLLLAELLHVAVVCSEGVSAHLSAVVFSTRLTVAVDVSSSSLLPAVPTSQATAGGADSVVGVGASADAGASAGAGAGASAGASMGATVPIKLASAPPSSRIQLLS